MTMLTLIIMIRVRAAAAVTVVVVVVVAVVVVVKVVAAREILRLIPHEKGIHLGVIQFLVAKRFK